MGFDATGGKPYKGSQDSPIWYAIVGVVILVCFAAVFLGPKLFGSKTADIDKTIPELVAGRTVPEAAGLLNAYGFQDELTKSVLIKMQQIDEIAHADLLTEMAIKAQEGASRNALSMMILDGAKDLYSKHNELVFSSEVAYLDQGLLLLSELSLEQQAAGGNSCDLASLYRISQNPDLAPKYLYYGSQIYQFSMRGVLLLLGSIEGGIVAPQSYGDLTSEDRSIVSPLIVQLAANPESLEFLAMLAKPEKASLVSDTDADGASDAKPHFEGINFCEQVDDIITGFQALPADTRARFWAAGLKETAS